MCSHVVCPHSQFPGAGPRLTGEDLLDPREGDFSNPDDRGIIEPVVRAICQEYANYEDSGSTVWDQTINVVKRPAWMKAVLEP